MNDNTNKLWQKYWNDRGDKQAFLDLLNYYSYIVSQIVNNIYTECGHEEDMDNLTCIGIFALSDIVQSYTPDHNLSFEEYSMPLIKQSIDKEIAWIISPYGQAWSKLARRDMLIIVFHYYEKCTFIEISDLLDIPIIVVEEIFNSVMAKLPPCKTLHIGPG